jgi:hypothetical protein
MAVMFVVVTVPVMLILIVVRLRAARRRSKISNAAAAGDPKCQARKNKHHDDCKHQRQFDLHGDSSLSIVVELFRG